MFSNTYRFSFDFNRIYDYVSDSIMNWREEGSVSPTGGIPMNVDSIRQDAKAFKRFLNISWVFYSALNNHQLDAVSDQSLGDI